MFLLRRLNSSQHNFSENFEPVSDVWQKVFGLAIVVVMSAGFVGNSLTIIAYKLRLVKPVPIVILIASLAVLDLLICVLIMPFQVARLYQKRWLFNYKLFNQLYALVFSCLVLSDLHILLLIGLCRLCLLFSNNCQNKRWFRKLNLVWSVLIVLFVNMCSLIFLHHFGLLSYQTNEYQLLSLTILDLSHTYLIIYFVFMYLFPVVVLNLVYIMLAIYLHRFRQQNRDVVSEQNDGQRSIFRYRHNRFRSIRVISAIMFFNMLSFIVSICFDMLAMTLRNNLYSILGVFTLYLVVLVNPLLYAILSTTFRRAFYSILSVSALTKRLTSLRTRTYKSRCMTDITVITSATGKTF